MPKISIARSAAHAILLAIEAGMGHSDDLLRDDSLMARMPEADRRLTTALVLGVLRWQILLDEQIRRFMLKPKAKFDPAVLIALRLGAFQLVYLDRVPAHAAINESVELVKQSGYRSAAGMVNALLRKIASGAKRSGRVAKEHGSTHSAGQDNHGLVTGHDFSRAEQAQSSTRAVAPEGSSSTAVAAHPAWMVDRWTRFFGPDVTCAICTYDQAQPSTAIRLSSLAVEQELTEAGVTLSRGNLLTAARILDSGDVTGTAPFRECRARHQDEGSQLIAEITAAAAGNPPRILDCCAAPGGKTLILAERNPAACLVACEASPPRLARLRHRLAALGDRVECRREDATVLEFESGFEVALADVPCSGTGTLSRNPEIRHRLKPADLPRQAERQRAILASALKAVRPGGRVVYSTCSLEPEENEDVVAAVIAGNPNARVAPLQTVLELLRDRRVLIEPAAEALTNALTPEGFLRLFPGAFGTDGFFVALVERLL